MQDPLKYKSVKRTIKIERTQEHLKYKSAKRKI